MMEVFRQVTAEVSPGFIEKFPAQFDIYGQLKQICEKNNVEIDYMNNVYNLKGQWEMVSNAHELLSRLLAIHGNGLNRQFSALMEAAEAIRSLSRGEALQEQVQSEMLQNKHRQGLTADYSYSTHMPDTIATDTDIKSADTQENSIPQSRVQLELCEPSPNVLTINHPHMQVPEYDVQALLRADGSIEKEALIVLSESKNDNHLHIHPQGHDNSHTYLHSKTDEEEYSDSNDFEDEDSDDSKQVAIQISGIHEQRNLQINHLGVQEKPFSANESSTEGIRNDISFEKESENSSRDEVKIESEESELVESIKSGDNGNEFSCDKCDFISDNKSALEDHMYYLHTTNSAMCPVCQKVFPNVRYMKRHLGCHGDPKYACDECGKQYKVKKALNDHIKKHNKEYIKPEFKCSDCPKKFCSNYILKCHTESEHMGNKKKFLCQTCGKSFTTKHTLLQHVNVHIGVRPYKCKDCGKAFSYESALRDHKFIHEGTKKFTCEHPKCNKAFRQRSALKMHEKIHKALKEFICDECGRGFTQKQALQRHVRSHEGLKPFTCKICKRSFGDASIIRRHMKLVHKINKDPSNWREDIVSTVPPKEDSDGAENSTDQINNQPPVATAVSFPQEPVGVTVKLPPVTSIQAFHQLDRFATSKLPLSQEQPPPTLTSQMPIGIPTQHDYIIDEASDSPQYSYTISTPPISASKPMIAPQPDISMYVQRIEMDKAENLQYLDENLDQTIEWKKLELLSRQSHEVAESGLAMQQLPDQHKVVTLDTDPAVVKEIAKSMETVQESLFYNIYPSQNLTSTHYNFNQYSGVSLQSADNTVDSQVQ